MRRLLAIESLSDKAHGPESHRRISMRALVLVAICAFPKGAEAESGWACYEGNGVYKYKVENELLTMIDVIYLKSDPPIWSVVSNDNAGIVGIRLTSSVDKDNKSIIKVDTIILSRNPLMFRHVSNSIGGQDFPITDGPCTNY